MARKSIKRALTAAILVAASLGVGIGAAAQPTVTAARGVSTSNPHVGTKGLQPTYGCYICFRNDYECCAG